MNSIVLTHFDVPNEAPSVSDLALYRLSEYVDNELGSVKDLLHLMGFSDAAADIAAIRGLHLTAASDSEDEERLLEEAVACLERLLDRLKSFPIRGTTTKASPPDLDAWINWSGARLDDIIATIRWALAE